MAIVIALIVGLLAQSSLSVPAPLIGGQVEAALNVGQNVNDFIKGTIKTSTSVVNDATNKGIHIASDALKNGVEFGKATTNKAVNVAKESLGIVDSTGDILGLRLPTQLGTGLGKLSLNGANQMTQAALDGGNALGQKVLGGVNNAVHAVTGQVDNVADAVHLGAKAGLGLAGGVASSMNTMTNLLGSVTGGLGGRLGGLGGLTGGLGGRLGGLGGLTGGLGGRLGGLGDMAGGMAGDVSSGLTGGLSLGGRFRLGSS